MMSFTDAIPVIAQTKSLVQLAAGNNTGARQTQENFVSSLNWYPGFCQARSLVDLAQGEYETGVMRQLTWFGGVVNYMNCVPVVGHVKGIFHYALGEEEAAGDAVASATRSAGVIGGGMAGVAVGGPVGSIVGGFAGAAATDGLITFTESTMVDEYRPMGYFEVAQTIREGQCDSSQYFDFTLNTALDGVFGWVAGLWPVQAAFQGLYIRARSQMPPMPPMPESFEKGENMDDDIINNNLEGEESPTWKPSKWAQSPSSSSWGYSESDRLVLLPSEPDVAKLQIRSYDRVHTLCQRAVAAGHPYILSEEHKELTGKVEKRHHAGCW